MIKKTVTYTDFDGNERTEDLYFNLTKNELIDIAVDMPTEISDTIGDNPENIDVEAAGRKVLEKLGGAGVIKFIRTLVEKAYGIKSEDGRRFIKTEQITTEFKQTMAYDAFIMGLLENDDEAANFINNVIPVDAANKATAMMNKKPALSVNN